MYISQSGAAQSYGCRSILQTALHQHHIRRIYCHIRPGTYGHSYICPCKGRCIVYSVTHHEDFTLLGKCAHHLFLAVGQNTCNYFVYSCLFTYGCSSLFVISCQHDHTDSHGLKLTYGLGAVFFDDISNGYYADKLFGACEE